MTAAAGHSRRRLPGALAKRPPFVDASVRRLLPIAVPRVDTPPALAIAACSAGRQRKGDGVARAERVLLVAVLVLTALRVNAAPADVGKLEADRDWAAVLGNHLAVLEADPGDSHARYGAWRAAMRLGLFEQALDRLLPLSPSITFVSPLAADGRVLFPTRRRPLAADVLNRVAWQIERRAGSPVFIDLQSAGLAESALLADLARYVNFAGVRLPTFPGDALAERALTSLARWCWPLRVAYAPPALPTPEQWARLRAGDLVVLPASPENMAAVPLNEKALVLFDFIHKACRESRSTRRCLLPVWANFIVSILWAHAMLTGLSLWAVAALLPQITGDLHGFSVVPQWWGTVLALTYVLQSVVSVSLDSRFEKGVAGSLFWVIWYPLVFWLLQTLTAVVGLPLALMRSKQARGTWVSPDRGIR